MKKGFTLIELLIVVAIIAILAAIAVPNFLEAQTRSKVSRCKADMRSLATAIESYYVDGNKYPVGFQGTIPGIIWQEGYIKYRLARLTTPIAFITSLPDDTFTHQNFAWDGYPGDEPSFIYHLKDYHNFRNYWATNPEFRLCVNSPFIYWVLISQGPVAPNTNYIVWVAYDPTNGTMSEGRIFRSGP